MHINFTNTKLLGSIKLIFMKQQKAPVRELYATVSL